jgi:hypothetical protein
MLSLPLLAPNRFWVFGLSVDAVDWPKTNGLSEVFAPKILEVEGWVVEVECPNMEGEALVVAGVDWKIDAPLLGVPALVVANRPVPGLWEAWFNIWADWERLGAGTWGMLKRLPWNPPDP